jgi:hypothetical protein
MTQRKSAYVSGSHKRHGGGRSNSPIAICEHSMCACGCGRPTQRRFHPGCDRAFYIRLLDAAGHGDQMAADLYRFMFKNNRHSAYTEQHRRARLWLSAQSAGSAIAAD